MARRIEALGLVFNRHRVARSGYRALNQTLYVCLLLLATAALAWALVVGVWMLP